MSRSVARLAISICLGAALTACDRSPTSLSPRIHPGPGPSRAVVQSVAIAADPQATAGPVIESVTFAIPDPTQFVDDMVVLFDSAEVEGPVVLEVVSNVTSGSDTLDVGGVMGGGGLLTWREGDELTDVWARMLAVDFAILKGGQVYIQRFFVPAGDSLRFVDMEAADHTLAVIFSAWEAYPVNGATATSSSAMADSGPIRLVPPSRDGQTSISVAADDCGFNRPPGSCEGGEPLSDRPNGSVAVRAMESTGPRLECTPTPLRGAEVVCTVTPQNDYNVLSLLAEGEEFEVPFEPGTNHLAGEPYEWRGPAVATSRVTFVFKEIINGQPTRKRYRDRFVVMPRQWPKLQLNAPTVTLGIRDTMRAYPDNDYFGNAQPDIPVSTFAELPVVLPDSGPNKGLAFLRDPFPGVDHSIYLHPALYDVYTEPFALPATVGQIWRIDQNGMGSGSCDSASLQVLTPFAERHEGVTQRADSHWGITNAFYQNGTPEDHLERMYTTTGDAGVLITEVWEEWDRLHDRTSHRHQQSAFESSEYPRLANALNCSFDKNLSDP